LDTLAISRMEERMMTLNTPRQRIAMMGWLLPVLLFSSASSSGQVLPPAPAVPISDLKMPESVVAEAITGPASVPASQKIGFALDLDNRVLIGDWTEQGRVTAVDPGKLTFVTAKGKKGNLVVKWPEGFQLPMKADDTVTIRRIVQPYLGAQEQRVSIAHEDKPLVDYGRVYGARPKQVSISENISIEQTTGPGKVLSETKFETTTQIPVEFVHGHKRIALNIGEPQLVQVGGKRFSVMISSSMRVVPTPEYEGVAEGAGYRLEYVWTRE
jgi:hypothetical protein